MSLLSLSLAISLFSNNPVPCDGGKMTITGKAINSLGAAAIEMSDGTVFFLSGKEEWGHSYQGKIVQVKGKAFSVTHKAESTPGSPVQEWVGTRCYIKRAKWKLAE